MQDKIIMMENMVEGVGGPIIKMIYKPSLLNKIFPDLPF